MKCPTCGSQRWKQGTATHVEQVDGRKFKAELAARVCGKCGEAIVTIDELDRFAVAVAVALAQAGACSGEAIRFMRKAIGLSATALADLLDVSMETVSRWEHGDRNAPLSAVAALGALVLDHANGSTATVDRLRALRKGPSLAKVVRVELRAVGRR
ncbi:MAG: type II toxin-antitoxin system MqsA family antitoxin [Polyangiaceae bacterium]|nr:type II toxin-antitoxin system MqsA family antitoxin [Polyangiaceae bacterium]